MALDIKGEAALVTGGGSGISFAFVKQLLRGSCNVVIADLALSAEAREVVAEHEGQFSSACFVKTDVTNWAQLKAAFNTAIDTFGLLDIACPGAGIFEPVCTLASTKEFVQNISSLE